MRPEISLAVALSTLILTSHKVPVLESFVGITPEAIQIPEPFMFEIKRRRNGYLPEGIDIGLLKRKVLLFPETR